MTQETEKVIFPEGKIVLTNGNVIQGYTPKRVSEEHTDKGHITEEYFTANAFFFLSHAREILADSRMFLSQVPVVSGLAYSGTSGFTMPTLGVYLEWWMSCKDAIVESNGQMWLIWHLAGSPLSGSNMCSLVNEDGKTQCHSVPNFNRLFRSFIKINQRYKEVKTKYAWFTLEEVVNILRNNDSDKEYRQAILDGYFLRTQNTRLKEELDYVRERYNKAIDRLTEATIRLNIDELRKLYNEFVEAREKELGKRQDLRNKRIELRRQLRGGALTNKQYQNLVHPINKELSQCDNAYWKYYYMVREQYPDIMLSDIEKFFKQEKETITNNKTDNETNE